MKVLGLSALYHDAAACLVVDGQVVAAAQEERFSRRKHDARFPKHAIAACLSLGGVPIEEIDRIAFYDKPFLKFDRLLETTLASVPGGFRSFLTGLPVWLQDKLFQKTQLLDELRANCGTGVDWARRLRFSEHHLSHAASAFYPSPFEEAAVLTLDGVGEWTTTSMAVGRGADLRVLGEIHFPHSLGLLYSAFTYYLGFKVNSGEYKVMGLAPYGKPRYAELIRQHLIDLRDDGSFWLDMRYFNYHRGLTMTREPFHRLFNGPPRQPEAPLTAREMDLAASIQLVTEEAVLKATRHLQARTGLSNLCLAGGVALNCVANGRLLREGPFERVWVQPAAGDAGGALGAALAISHLEAGVDRRRSSSSEDGMKGSLLGPLFSPAQVEADLRAAGAVFTTMAPGPLVDRAAQTLADGLAVGWFQGRMEFGPRSLGARSILADPRAPHMQRQLNLKIKFRESFRPFAPAVLQTEASRWFDLQVDSPYMQFVCSVQPGRDIPAVTHVDGSARVQTVGEEAHPQFRALLQRFGALTGCPVLVNTSFNVRGEPIVCTPADAYRCFMGTDLDVLVVENCILFKTDQPQARKQRYEGAFELD
jgi:carbamoyltransferase